MSGERGQTNVEYLAILAVIVALVGALAVGAPVIASAISDTAQRIICSITGQQCGAPPQAFKPPNTVVCMTSQQTNTAQDQFEVSFVQVGHNNTLIEKHYSDGSVQFTLVDGGQLKAKADLFEAQAQLGGFGFDAEASAAAGGDLTGSHTWTFSNAQAADAAKFKSQVESAGGVGVVLHDAAGPVGGWILDKVGVHGAPNPSSLAQQNLTSSYVEESAVGQLNGEASAGAGNQLSAQLKGELQAAAGFREITAGPPPGATPPGPPLPQKGDVQVFVKLSGNATGTLQDALIGPHAAGSAQANGVAIVTLGSDGSPKTLQITASGDYTAAAGLGAKGGQKGGILKKLDLSATDGAGMGLQYTGTLDLRDNPTAQAQLVSLLNPSTAGPAAATLVAQMDSQGTERVQPYRLTRSQGGGGLALEVADIGAGANATVSRQNQGYSPGWAKNPGQSWAGVTCG